ncbi:MAG: hypothetical protein IKQ90_04390 [Ruminococcus sp.]|nr:hypothetical protein [Ruminococcus sp.]
MSSDIKIITELPRDEYTEIIYDDICFGQPINAMDPEDVTKGINRAIELDEQSGFLEGVSERLRQLGIDCTPGDTEIMLAEIRRRYKEILGFPCPRTVQEWIKGTTPGFTNRRNNYDLCYALGMDFRQTVEFFQKKYLTLPFIVKSKEDAVFMYCLYHKKPYSKVMELLERSEGFATQADTHTSTSQIAQTILKEDDDEKFLRYLSQHCYGKEQQFRLAKSIINRELETTHKYIIRDRPCKASTPDRLNSFTIEELLGYNYQTIDKKSADRKLPKRFTSSLPNDVTLGRIVNGEAVSYELLRKTLMLLKFYNFYHDADNKDPMMIGSNLMDFYDELNASLASCGFAQIYECHPFDCLLLYCANSELPIETLHLVSERN